MIQLHAAIEPAVELSAQVQETVGTEGRILESQTQITAQVTQKSGFTASLLPAVLLCACLAPTTSLDAQLLPPEWTDGAPANLITADGYFIRTDDGYLLCVQDM